MCRANCGVESLLRTPQIKASTVAHLPPIGARKSKTSAKFNGGQGLPGSHGLTCGAWGHREKTPFLVENKVDRPVVRHHDHRDFVTLRYVSVDLGAGV